MLLIPAILPTPSAASELAFSRHADKRIRQRELRERDVDLVLQRGTHVGRDAIVLLDADVEREIATRKHEIQALERLRGYRIVVCDDRVITCYHTHTKRAAGLRHAKGRKGRPQNAH